LLQSTITTPSYSLQHQKLLGACVDCYDGDTVTMALQPFGDASEPRLFKCRLEGIDTPEMRGDVKNKPKAYEARNTLASWLSTTPFTGELMSSRKSIQEHLYKSKKLILVECGGWDKYGRLLVKLYSVLSVNGDHVITRQQSLNELLITTGFAKPYDGGTKSNF